MSEVCRQQAALTPSLALAPRATPDDVELGIRQLAEAAVAVAPPPGDTEVASARARLNDAAGTWLALAEAVSTSAAGREAGTEQIRAAVAALAAAGAGDCDRLLPRRSG